MNKLKRINTAGIILVAIVWFILSVLAWVASPLDISVTERRPLAQFPDIGIESILSGKFIEKFEEYTLDQFPARDTFRQVKSIFHYYVMRQKDNNDIFVENGCVAKMEYPLNEKSLEHANMCFNKIYEKYLKDTNSNIYMAVIPDKSYYIAEANGYLSMDYSVLFETIKNGTPWATHIDITSDLSIEDYYRTDSHWKQECIIDVARSVCSAMNTSLPDENSFSKIKIERPFYGVYYGQAALSMQPDNLYILTNKIIENCTVTDFETGKTSPVYNEAMIESKDLYDIYLLGAKAILSIENPNATTDKELIVFRDSFGSSLSPLLLQSYAKITLIDIRYVNSDYIEKFVSFDNQEVLFLYSTLVLNSSFSLK